MLSLELSLRVDLFIIINLSVAPFPLLVLVLLRPHLNQSRLASLKREHLIELALLLHFQHLQNSLLRLDINIHIRVIQLLNLR